LRKTKLKLKKEELNLENKRKGYSSTQRNLLVITRTNGLSTTVNDDDEGQAMASPLITLDNMRTTLEKLGF